MEMILPLVLVGFGSAGLLIVRRGPALVAALLAQWLGLVGVGIWGSGGTVDQALSISEPLVALTCSVILFLTLLAGATAWPRPRGTAPLPRSAAGNPMDDLWPLAVAVAGAIGGLALARLYPIGGTEGTMIAFYWTVLSAVLLLVLDGARDALKLAAGTLALLNGAAFLLGSASPAAAEPVALVLLAAARILLAGLFAFVWAVLGALFGRQSLTPLFDLRDPGSAQIAGANDETLPGDLEQDAREAAVVSEESEPADPTEPDAPAPDDYLGGDDEDDAEWLRRGARPGTAQQTGESDARG